MQDDRIFHIWSPQEEVIGIVSNRFGDGHTILSARHKEGDNTLRMLIDANDEKAALFENGCFVGFFDNDQKYQRFEIKDADVTAAAASTREIYAEHDKYELAYEPVTDIRPTDTSVGQAVTQGLQHTRWELGSTVSVGSGSARGYYTSVHAYLIEVQASWSVEMEYELVVERNVITRRLVHVLTRRGAFRGRRFEYTKDTQSIKGYFSSADIRTALIGRGSGAETGTTEDGDATTGRRLLFDGIELSAANGDPVNKPLGQIYIEDAAAKARWGFAGGTRNRFDFVVFDQITDPHELALATYEELQARKEPIYSYKLVVTDLERSEGPHEAVRMGDTVYAIHRAIQPAIELEARVVDIDRDLLNDENTTLELGNARARLSDKMVSTIKLAEKAQGINENGTFPTDHLAGIIDTLKNQLVASGEYAQAEVLKDKGFLLENNNPSSTGYGALYLGPGILAIANSKVSGEWKWRTFGTGKGFTADEITAGTINAALVKMLGSGTELNDTELVIKHTGVGALAETRINGGGLGIKDAVGQIVAGLMQAGGRWVLGANALQDPREAGAPLFALGHYRSVWDGVDVYGLSINDGTLMRGALGRVGNVLHLYGASDIAFESPRHLVTLSELASLPDRLERVEEFVSLFD